MDNQHITDPVVGGVDTHKDLHVASIVSIRRGTRSRGLDSFLLGLPVPWEQFRQA
jgi:hypothetical protein